MEQLLIYRVNVLILVSLVILVLPISLMVITIARCFQELRVHEKAQYYLVL